VVGEFKEVGSGLNGYHHNALLKILGNSSFSVIVVEQKERLARFGADYDVEASLKASNRELRIINEQELNIDLVQDMEAARR